jgi:hypothetical protein
VRAFGDLWYRDEVRVFVEGIWADSRWQEAAPLAQDVNPGDPTGGPRRRPRRNYTILRHAFDSVNSAEKALIHA